MTEQQHPAPQTAEQPAHSASPPARRPGRWHLVAVGIGVVLALVITLTGWESWGRHGSAHRASVEAAELALAAQDGEQTSNANEVEVVAPERGGIQRICTQPGTVEPFEAADLYAKVSGFLAQQTVDIGAHVKAGQLLAKISVPELEKQVARDEATLVHEQAKVAQAQAQLLSAQARAKAAKVSVSLAETVYKAKTSYRKYREKQLNRYTELNHQRAIEPKVVDEAQDYFESSLEAEAAAKEAIAQAQERATAAEADIALAAANLKESEAGVNVAAAELEKSRVMLGYTEIRSPYNGVITRRSFHPGDFIRAADLGGAQQPMLSVERTDKMRVVVNVPDRDVPYVNVGDVAELQVDALPGLVIKAVVARKAESEDVNTRTMRTEVDVENAKGLLYRGMYGQATLRLDSGPAVALRIPSAALLGKVDEHHAQVRVVENGKLRTIPIQIGADNGMQTEVMSGLTPNQMVVVRGSSAITDGTLVSVTVRPNQL